MKGKIFRHGGVLTLGIKTPIIKQGDDLQEIVISSVAETIGEDFDDGDVIGVTEAVVAISQGNLVTSEDIRKDIATKFAGAKRLAIVDPIQSRNRFMDVLKAIAKTPSLEKVYIVMTYPTDEVGNRFVSDEAIMESGVNPYTDVFTSEEFCSIFGEPKHTFTGKNYIEEYKNACEGKAEVILGNDFAKIATEIDCDDFLICSIHRRNETRKFLERGGAKRVLDLSQIMNKSIDGSGYNVWFGLYGSNLMSEGRQKLMPRNCQNFVDELQEKIKERYGKTVEVFINGDGCFKDPIGGIWELADPEACLASTSGLYGIPKEVKLKNIAGQHEDKTPEEIEAIVAEESAKRKSTDDITGEASLGTTPRRKTDLLASLADLTTGSGDRQTPVVYIKNYL